MQITVNGRVAKQQILFSAEDIQKRVQDLAKQINAAHDKEQPLVILIVLNGAILFAADLIRHLNMPTEIETVRLKSYVGTQSTGKIELVTPLPADLKGKHVLVVEDIVETGHTVEFLLQQLRDAQVADVKVCTLLDKPMAHPAHLKAEYIGFEIEKHFVLGYGLDLDGRYRHLPYILQLLF